MALELFFPRASQLSKRFDRDHQQAAINFDKLYFATLVKVVLLSDLGGDCDHTLARNSRKLTHAFHHVLRYLPYM